MQMGDQFIRVLENDRQVLHIVHSHANGPLKYTQFLTPSIPLAVSRK